MQKYFGWIYLFGSYVVNILLLKFLMWELPKFKLTELDVTAMILMSPIMLPVTILMVIFANALALIQPIVDWIIG
jgi:hypothetical protein